MGWKHLQSLLTGCVGNSDLAARWHRKQLYFETVIMKGTKEHTRATQYLHIANEDYNNLNIFKAQSKLFCK